MKWAIQCADANTGQEFSLIVDASSQTDAEAQARKRGLLVSEIIAAGEPAAVEKQSPADEAQRRQANPVDYAIPGSTVPEYRGLRWGAMSLRIIAYLCYALGILTLVSNVLEIYKYGPGSAAWITGALSFAMYFWPFVLGLFFHVLAEACTALRDIARNSFRAES